MARGLSKKDKAEGYDDLKRRLDAFQSYAWHVANEHNPDAMQVVTEENDLGCTHEFYLFGAKRADGGTLVYIFKSNVNAYHSVDCWRFDDWQEMVRTKPHGVGIWTDVKIACERLTSERWRLLQETHGIPDHDR